MFLAKRSNGIYQIYFINKNGKRTSKSTGCKKKSDALKVLSKFKDEIDLQNSTELISISFSKMIWEFLKHAESIYTSKSIKNFRNTFRFAQDYFGDIDLDKMNDVLIRRYLDKRLRDSSIYQARKDKINLSSLFTRAIEWGYLTDNPCRKIKNYKLPEKQPIYFSKEEFNNLLSCIESIDLKDIVVFAVNTGLRQSELLNLQWEQIDLERKLVILDNRTHITKSKKVRTIPLNESAMNVIKSRLNNDHKRVFTFEGNLISQHALSIRFRYILNKNHFKNGLKFHSLRHTFASWLIQKGVSIYVVSKLLGHSDIKTTEVYSHLSLSNFEDAVSII